MAGLLSVYAFDELWDVTSYLRYGAMALQHRGLEKGIICYPRDGSIKCMEFVDFEALDQGLGSHVGILGLYSNGDVYIAKAFDRGVEVILLADRIYSELDNIAKDVSYVLSSSSLSNVVDAISKVFRKYVDAPTIIVLSNRSEVIAWRSGLGLTPLVLGGYGFDISIATSESVAIDILGAEYRKDFDAGEGAYISRHMFKTFRVTGGGGAICAFELLYLARPDSVIGGISIYQFRKRLGEEVASRFDKHVDIVVGVPEAAYPYALAFSQKLGKPLELALIPTGYRQRSMLKSDPMEKIIAIHLKMNPIKMVLEGRRIALVDDSMVTGATIKTVAQILRFGIGVEEIHLVIASPPLTSSCPYKVFNLDVGKLLAANLGSDLVVKYLDVDSVTWIDYESMDRVARGFGTRLCGKCFNRNFFGDSK